MPFELRSRVRPVVSVPSDFRTLMGACTGTRRSARRSDPWVAIAVAEVYLFPRSKGIRINAPLLVRVVGMLYPVPRSPPVPVQGWACYSSANVLPSPDFCRWLRFTCRPSPAEPEFPDYPH